MSESLQIFADGSFDAAAGAGGWAFVVHDGGLQVHSAHGPASGTSNNTFEVMAVLKAVSWTESFAAGRAATIWTDSNHVVESCDRWRAIWRGNGWKRINPNPKARRRAIPDADLWQKLDAMLVRNSAVTIEWCKGHSGFAGNESADDLARQIVEALRFRR